VFIAMHSNMNVEVFHLRAARHIAGATHKMLVFEKWHKYAVP